MDYKQLLKDIFTLNLKTFVTRGHKLAAVLKRSVFKPSVDFNSDNNFYSIPIIINNRNRFTYLKQLVDWLTHAGYKNIIILDNESNYDPLINYYKSIPAKVIYLKNNYGHLALWRSGVYKQFYGNYYAYTDPDVLPVESCPKDFMKYFLSILNKYSGIEKVGFGLKIDDLPDHYEKKADVIEWEKKFWEKEIDRDVYDAAVDTTFALYKPYTNGNVWVQNAVRTGGNYVMRHLPWYENSKNPDPENKFYLENIKKGASHWIVKNDK